MGQTLPSDRLGANDRFWGERLLTMIAVAKAFTDGIVVQKLADN
jgi:hypothetical protein